MIVYLNGEWVAQEDARIPITDRGFLFSDGVFETARIVNSNYFRLQQHLDRLQESARVLSLRTPSINELKTLAYEIVDRNSLVDASLRITVTRGSGGAGLKTRGADHPTVLITAANIAADWKEKAARGWSLITAQTLRPPTSSIPAQLKALGRVYAILATLEAERAGADDALLLTANSEIAEGPTWNFFWRKGAVLRTAALEGGILEGVTRKIIIEIAQSEGLTVEEGLWARPDLDDADEAFATMTSQGVVPIRTLDGREMTARNCATQFQARYWNMVHDEVRAG